MLGSGYLNYLYRCGLKNVNFWSEFGVAHCVCYLDFIKVLFQVQIFFAFFLIESQVFGTIIFVIPFLQRQQKWGEMENKRESHFWTYHAATFPWRFLPTSSRCNRACPTPGKCQASSGEPFPLKKKRKLWFWMPPCPWRPRSLLLPDQPFICRTGSWSPTFPLVTIHEMVTSKLDQCNSLYMGLPLGLIQKLQLVKKYTNSGNAAWAT